jgi:hypothetical protein
MEASTFTSYPIPCRGWRLDSPSRSQHSTKIRIALQSPPAARGGYVARDEEKSKMFFSFLSLKSGTEAVSKGGSLWLIFFRHFFVQ